MGREGVASPCRLGQPLGLPWGGTLHRMRLSGTGATARVATARASNWVEALVLPRTAAEPPGGGDLNAGGTAARISS